MDEEPSLKIGNVDVPGKFVLAPMVTVNCTAFRMLCKENKASLICTQMIDVNIIKNRKKSDVKEILTSKSLNDQ